MGKPYEGFVLWKDEVPAPLRQGQAVSVQIPVSSEHDEQVTLFDWLRRVAWRQEPQLIPLTFAVPNGSHLAGSAGIRAYKMTRMKAEGFAPGVADVVCLLPRQGHHFLVVEMKRRSEKPVRDGRGGVSAEQLNFLGSVAMVGGLGRVCYGADEAIGVFTWYLGIKE